MFVTAPVGVKKGVNKTLYENKDLVRIKYKASPSPKARFKQIKINEHKKNTKSTRKTKKQTPHQAIKQMHEVMPRFWILYAEAVFVKKNLA